MESPEANSNIAVVVFLSVIFLGIVILRRYGRVGQKLVEKLGPRWPMFIKIGSMATLALWILLWALAGPERSGELRAFYEQTAPWVAR